MDRERLVISNGSAYADIDNDGDLDVITNNLNSVATLYINGTDTTSNYLKINCSLKEKHLRNRAKVISYAKGKSNLKNCKRQEGFNLHLNRLFILAME
jgi:hypothetical protein